MKSQNTISIAELTFFTDLDGDSVQAMQSIAQQHTLFVGESLFKQGDMAHSFYIVVRGGVRLIEHTSEGKSMNLKVYGPDDVFGLLAVSGRFSHDAKIEAIEHSEIVAFNGKKTRQIMHAHPDVALRVIDTLIAHVHHAHSRIRQMAVEKTEQRLARALLHFCEKFNTADTNNLSANFSQQDIAEFTGTTVETVNRTFKKWEHQQLIQHSRMRVTVMDTEALRKIADNVSNVGMGYLVE